MTPAGVRRQSSAANKAPAPDVRVQVQRAAGRRGVPRNADFTSWVVAALKGARRLLEPLAVTLRVVAAGEMRLLNQAYRDRDYATNVLSFPETEMVGVVLARRPLGDIVLCTEVLLREAAEQAKPAAAHWAHLTVHGVLHLLAYDHERQRDAAVMEALERQILRRLGVADPYT